LIHSDEHPNVVRYYAKEEDEEFIYLVLSFCPMTLQELVENYVHKKLSETRHAGDVDSEIMRILHELVNGMVHLHSLNIVHRDIKPQNILLDPFNKIKISDMGLAKKLDIDQSSFSGRDSGSVGWQAPEILEGTRKGRLTKAVDIFALGCVIYYILTKSHPFGAKYEREMRILKGQPNLDGVARWPEARHLIGAMLMHNAEDRITAREAFHHPFFWTTHQKMHFLIAASDFLEFEKVTAPAVARMDSFLQDVVDNHQNDWMLGLDPFLIDNLGQYRKYKGNSLRDLLRVIRNKFNHFRDLPPDIQSNLGPIPDGFFKYFQVKFPRLLICTYVVMHEFVRNEEPFKLYFINKKHH